MIFRAPPSCIMPTPPTTTLLSLRAPILRVTDSGGAAAQAGETWTESSVQAEMLERQVPMRYRSRSSDMRARGTATKSSQCPAPGLTSSRSQRRTATLPRTCRGARSCGVITAWDRLVRPRLPKRGQSRRAACCARYSRAPRRATLWTAPIAVSATKSGTLGSCPGAWSSKQECAESKISRQTSTRRWAASTLALRRTRTASK